MAEGQVLYPVIGNLRFRTVEALPLAESRSQCPRNCHGRGVKRPLNVMFVYRFSTTDRADQIGRTGGGA